MCRIRGLPNMKQDSRSPNSSRTLSQLAPGSKLPNSVLPCARHGVPCNPCCGPCSALGRSIILVLPDYDNAVPEAHITNCYDCATREGTTHKNTKAVEFVTNAKRKECRGTQLLPAELLPYVLSSFFLCLYNFCYRELLLYFIFSVATRKRARSISACCSCATRKPRGKGFVSRCIF